jgi:putative acetyltransferase
MGRTLEVAALGASNASSIARLASRPDVVAFGEHEPEQPSSAWAAWLGAPDPSAGLVVGAWRAGELCAVARLTLGSTRRRLHAADLALLASAEREGDAPLEAVLRAVTESADRWLQVLRCELRCPAGHTRISGLFGECGFRFESQLRGSIRRDGRLADEAVLARVREDAPPPAARSPSFSMESAPPASAAAAATIRPARWGDGPALSATMSEASVLWGTLQLPFQRPERWDARLGVKPARSVLLVAEVEGQMAGAGALTVSRERRRSHVATLGMHVVRRYQGRGVGAALMRALLEQAKSRDVRRVELTVYPDNERAIRLYERHEFVHEGRSRCSSFRDGTYVDDLVMARLE